MFERQDSERTTWDWILDDEFLNRRSHKVFVLTGFMGGCIDRPGRVVDLKIEVPEEANTP